MDRVSVTESSRHKYYFYQTATSFCNTTISPPLSKVSYGDLGFMDGVSMPESSRNKYYFYQTTTSFYNTTQPSSGCRLNLYKFYFIFTNPTGFVY